MAGISKAERERRAKARGIMSGSSADQPVKWTRQEKLIVFGFALLSTPESMAFEHRAVFATERSRQILKVAEKAVAGGSDEG